MDVVTNHLAIVGVYAALNAIIMMTLGFMTGHSAQIQGERSATAESPHMIRIMRGRANATENVPIMVSHDGHQRPE